MQTETLTEPIVIHRSVDRSGATYALNPRSERYVHSASPQADLPPRVFIASQRVPAQDDTMNAMAPLVASLLTGLTEAQLKKIGVAVVDPVSEKELYRWPRALRR